MSNYWSVNEWAESTSQHGFVSPQRFEVAQASPATLQEEPSGTHTPTSIEHVSQHGSEADFDVMSEDERISTPGGWSEVGSVVSEDY